MHPSARCVAPAGVGASVGVFCLQRTRTQREDRLDYSDILRLGGDAAASNIASRGIANLLASVVDRV